jgi:hypothetical protein
MSAMRIRRRPDHAPAQAPADITAAEDARRHAGGAVAQIDEATGENWYEPGGAADRAALTLCRLRRARAGELGGMEHGDEAVRDVLRQADPDAVVWLASRTISYLDESGFPEAVEPWFERALEPD